MRINNFVKILGIALIAMFVGSGLVAAAHDGSHGKAYDMGNGVFAELKSGSLESGVFETWGDSDSHHHVTVEIVVDGETWIISYKVAGNSGAKIVGAEKVVKPTPVDPVVPGNETEPVVPQNDTPVVPVKNDTEPIVPVKNDTEPIVPAKNETEPVVPENETPVVPVVPGNNTDDVVPHVSGDDVTSANGANATIENATANTNNGADENGVEMKRAGNPYFLAIIAIFLLIGAVAYSKRY